MTRVEIPSKLTEMAQARRVIPFIGAGFSSSLNLPDWDSLLMKLAEDLEDSIPYNKVKEFCHHDYLQIAEYYYLINDGRVGPMRQAISTALQSDVNPLKSGMHVELVNLGASQIYTTNFDDLIEKTFKNLKQPIEVISLPKHLATSSNSKTQIIKYHGDLKHEQTLVLTESSYYARLDLESPMDIKFRSDLLGKSVLFMGYSFRDINIRIIWFKLMRMMKDIRPEDRPTSFIVTFTPNPVLEKLYKSVGIDTICLDPNEEVERPEQRTDLMSDFLFRLVNNTATNGQIVGHPNQQLFYSQALTSAIFDAIESEEISQKSPRLFRSRSQPSRVAQLYSQASTRTLLVCHKETIQKILLEKNYHIFSSSFTPLTYFAINYSKTFGVDSAPANILIRSLARTENREILRSKSSEIDWKSLWAAVLPVSFFEWFIDILEDEIGYHQKVDVHLIDHDLAFLADIAIRVSKNQIVPNLSEAQNTKLNSLIEELFKIYPSILNHTLCQDRFPDVVNITTEIDQAIKMAEGADKDDDDLPF